MARPPPSQKKVETPPGYYAITIDQIFDDRERDFRMRRRI